VDQTITTTARKGVSYLSGISANYVTSWDDGSLPTKGLSFAGTTSSIGTAYADISGTPTEYGSATFTVTPYNAASETPGGVQFTINILDEALVWSDQLLTSSIATQDESYADRVYVGGSPNVTYSVYSGALPDGLTLNSSTGDITGTPTIPGVYNFVIRATNGSNETLNTNTLSLTVESAGGYVQVKTLSGWQNATVYVKTAGGWVEGTVNVKKDAGWGPSFSD
jgi:hypothetical protein